MVPVVEFISLPCLSSAYRADFANKADIKEPQELFWIFHNLSNLSSDNKNNFTLRGKESSVATNTNVIIN